MKQSKIQRKEQIMRISLQSRKNIQIKKQINHQEESAWDKLIYKLIRPPRCQYRPSSLGPFEIDSPKGKYTRTQEVVNHHGKNIYLTMITPHIKNLKVVLYLHGNSSSRIQGLSLLKHLPEGYTLASFDFMGCGNNQEEETISLGVRQSEQISSVVQFLQEKHYNVILWGRSMGAASALKYGKVDVIVADSSFRSMKKLCKEFAKRNKPEILPQCLVSCLFPCVFQKLKSDVKKKGHFDLDELQIEESVKKIAPTTAIIFILGSQDTLISQKHSQRMYDSFKGKNKYLEIVKGGHNTRRPDETLKKIMGLIDFHSNQHQIFEETPIKMEQIKPKFN